MPTKLNEIKVSLNQLVLDPNNPRFVQQTSATEMVSDAEAIMADIQESLLSRFTGASSVPAPGVDEPDTIGIEDLRDSMLRIGYVTIDKIVVRKIEGTDCYLVLEGNRRVASLKSLKRDYDSGNLSIRKKEAPAYERHKGTFELLNVLELQTTGFSAVDIQRSISVILGIRHHGSVLQWQPVARAFNIYTEYKKLAGGKVEEIKLGLMKDVAARLCISQSEVKQFLRSYIAFMQLKDALADDVQNDHFSLIETAVTNTHLANAYFNIDANTYRLDEGSLERLNRICQFGRRNRMANVGLPKKIITDPRAMRRLGQIVQKKLQKARNDSERDFVSNVLTRIEDEGDELTVDQGLELVAAYLEALQWKATVAGLLIQQKEKLPEELYQGTGNERGFREAAQRIVEHLSLIMKI